MPPNVPPPPPEAAGDDDDIIELTEIVEKGTLGDSEDDDLFSLDDNDVDISFEQELEELFSEDDGDAAPAAGAAEADLADDLGLDMDADLGETMDFSAQEETPAPAPAPAQVQDDEDDGIELLGVDDDTVDENSSLDFNAAMEELSADGLDQAPASNDQEMDLDSTLAFDEDFEAKLGMAQDEGDDGDGDELDLDAALAGLDQADISDDEDEEEESDELDLDATLAMTDDLAVELAGGGMDFELDEDEEMAATVREDDMEHDLLADIDDDAGGMDMDLALGGLDQLDDDPGEGSGPSIPDLDQLTDLSDGEGFTLELGDGDNPLPGLDESLGDEGGLDIPLVDEGDEEDEGQDLLADEDEELLVDQGLDEALDQPIDEELDQGLDQSLDENLAQDLMDLQGDDEDEPGPEHADFDADEEDIDISELDDLIDELDLPEGGGEIPGIETPVTQTEVESLIKERNAAVAAAASPQAQDLSAVMERLDALEAKLQEVSQAPGAADAVDVDKSIDQALSEGSPHLATIAQAVAKEMGAVVQQAVASLEERIVTKQELDEFKQSLGRELTEQMEKTVPEAAARILREEIAHLSEALLSDEE